MSERLVSREVTIAIEGRPNIDGNTYSRRAIQKLAKQSNVRVEEREDGKLVAIATILQTMPPTVEEVSDE